MDWTPISRDEVISLDDAGVVVVHLRSISAVVVTTLDGVIPFFSKVDDD